MYGSRETTSKPIFRSVAKGFLNTRQCQTRRRGYQRVKLIEFSFFTNY